MDLVFIEDLRIETVIGIYDWERTIKQTIALDNLSPFTHYAVGIRAYDNCAHDGPLVVVTFETPTVEVGCGCHSADPAGLALALVGLRLRRRRRRR